MYVVFVEELDGEAVSTAANTVATLEEAFARIACRCGLSYRFVPEDEGWRLDLIDVERPNRSPEAIRTSYKRLQDAQRDLIDQAVDGRIRGHVALHVDAFVRASVMRNARGVRVLVA